MGSNVNTSTARVGPSANAVSCAHWLQTLAEPPRDRQKAFRQRSDRIPVSKQYVTLLCLLLGMMTQKMGISPNATCGGLYFFV